MQLNVKIAQLSKNKCDTIIKLSEMEILACFRSYSSQTRDLNNIYFSMIIDKKEQRNIRAAEMEAFHLRLQERDEHIQKLKAVVGLMEPLKEHHGGARMPCATNTHNIKSEEKSEIKVTEMRDVALIDNLQDKIQTIFLNVSAAEHALAMEKKEAALLCQRIFQLTSEKLKIVEYLFLTKTTPKPLKTNKTNKPSLKNCKVLKAFKALLIFKKIKK
ncbi:unnamed protein product [Coregonus sp. 'balchen']|nr:unnamed protein product [Coregonus sp. 'balchen']